MRVVVNEPKYVTVDRAAIQRIAKCEKDGLCRACLGKIKRGEKIRKKCHERCYVATRRAVARGLTTYAKRIREGKWPADDEIQSGRPASNPVTMELTNN